MQPASLPQLHSENGRGHFCGPKHGTWHYDIQGFFGTWKKPQNGMLFCIMANWKECPKISPAMWVT